MIKVLILGGGFGGIRCALDLDKKFKGQARITLVDRNGYHLFLPSLYEAASVCGLNEGPFAVKMRKTICVPYGEIFAGKNINPHIHFGQFLKNIFLPWQKPKVSVGVKTNAFNPSPTKRTPPIIMSTNPTSENVYK